jgi:hypothetical protein
MFKQICFFRKRPDMSMEQFMDYYENYHSRLGERIGNSSIAKAQRYVRRYLKPEKNPVTGEVLDPGFDCIMEVWWNSREDFDAAQAIVSDPARLPHSIEDEKKLFASHSNPVCSIIEECDSPVGPGGTIPRWERVES